MRRAPTWPGPLGILYVPAQDQFYFAGLDPTVLYSTDAAGSPLPSLSVQYPAGTDPSDIVVFEGLAYIPDDSPEFPGTIAAVTVHAQNFVSRVSLIGPVAGCS